MRRQFLSLACGIVGGLFAVTAEGGTLSAATWTTQIGGVNGGDTFPVPIAASGTSTATSASVSLTLPPFSIGVFGTGGTLNTYRALTLGGSQALIAAPSMATASMGVPGTFNVKAAVHVGKGVNASMLTPAVTTLIKIGLNVGAVGTSTGYFYVSTAAHYVTVDHYAWMPHTQTFTGLTLVGEALPDVVAMGSFDLTANGAGTVTLVSPSRIRIPDSFAQQRTVTLTTLTLTFVPEPQTLLLLGASGLVLLRLRPRS